MKHLPPIFILFYFSSILHVSAQMHGGFHSSSPSSSGSHVPSRSISVSHSGSSYGSTMGSRVAATPAHTFSLYNRSPYISKSGTSNLRVPIRNTSGQNPLPTSTAGNEVRPGYTPYYYYDYAPYYYNPYYSMWAFGFDCMFSPHYCLGSLTNNNNSSDYTDGEQAEGFVVYENDTLSGHITIKDRLLTLENSDSIRNYDYVIHYMKKGLKYVSALSSGNSELILTRTDPNNQKLWRLVHTGKLSIYDVGHHFIYRPEDIDVGTLLVIYNGQSTVLDASSKVNKQRLTAFVNKAYNTELNPNDFTWESLLVYIDKLN